MPRFLTPPKPSDLLWRDPLPNAVETVAAVTFVLLDQILGTSRRKAELIAQLGSEVNEETIRAAEELRRHGWHEDGSLQGAKLYFANMQTVILVRANLQGAALDRANLQDTGLSLSNLQGASLGSANLQNAKLARTNLQEAILWEANLQGATLVEANLQGAILGVPPDPEVMTPGDAIFADSTELPDGTYWTPDTDMTRFTDPNHSDFWHSEDPNSPAYRAPDAAPTDD